MLLHRPSGEARDFVSPGTSNDAEFFRRRQEFIVVGVKGVPLGVDTTLIIEESDADDVFVLAKLLWMLEYIGKTKWIKKRR